MIRLLTLLNIIILLATPTFARAEEPCDDLWFARNSLMNDAGYCFNSNLGKAIFDNSDCHTKQPKLSARSQAWVKEIQTYESNHSCKVDTKKNALNITNFALRKRLGTQPINDGLESACIGYKGEKEIPLYADISTNSEVLGFIQPGDDIGYSHIAYEIFPSGWSFISSAGNLGETKARLGWVKDLILLDKHCTAFAG